MSNSLFTINVTIFPLCNKRSVCLQLAKLLGSFSMITGLNVVLWVKAEYPEEVGDSKATK